MEWLCGYVPIYYLILAFRQGESVGLWKVHGGHEEHPRPSIEEISRAGQGQTQGQTWLRSEFAWSDSWTRS